MSAFDAAAVEVLLCDADGNLFPSEEPAFVASAEVTNRLMEALGVPRRYDPEELRLATTGMNFRRTATALAEAHGVELGAAELERWVEEEKRHVTAHLGRVLRPDPEVTEPLRAVAGRLELAAVSSSASARLDACFEATGLAALIGPERRFSAEDSLPEPASKPDPAIYALAGERLGVAGTRALAVEDAVPGVLSAAGAGFPVAGNVMFVPPAEREQRRRELLDAGAATVVATWRELAALLREPDPVGSAGR